MAGIVSITIRCGLEGMRTFSEPTAINPSPNDGSTLFWSFSSVGASPFFVLAVESPSSERTRGISFREGEVRGGGVQEKKKSSLAELVRDIVPLSVLDRSTPLFDPPFLRL